MKLTAEPIPDGGRTKAMESIVGKLVATLDPSEALAAALAYDGAHCKPPLGEKRIARMVEDFVAKDTPTIVTAYVDPEVPVPPAEGLTRIRAVFTKWLLLPDTSVVDMALAALVAHRSDEEPLWPLLVSPPSGGKTEVIRALSGAPEVYALSSLTSQTLVSGFTGRKRASLLERLAGTGSRSSR